MKFSIFVCAAFIIVIVRAENSKETTDTDEVFREEYCNSSNRSKKDDCSSYRCNKDNTKIIGVACAEARCSGKPVGFKGDPTKPYPDCCMIPVCEDSSD